MSKKNFEQELLSILGSKNSFDKYVRINSKLNNVAEMLLISGGIAVGYNVISTFFSIIKNIGIRYVPMFFWAVFFSKEGENIIFYVMTIAGLIAIVVGAILLLIYKKKKAEIQSGLYSDFYELESLVLEPVYEINPMYVIDISDEDALNRVDEFIGGQSKESLKLAKLFSQTNNKTGMKAIEKSIEKYSGEKIKINQIIPRNSPFVVSVGDEVFECYILDKNNQRHNVDIHKMRKDSVLNKKNA